MLLDLWQGQNDDSMFAIVKELCSFIPRRPAFASGFSGKAVFLREVSFSIKRASLSVEIGVKDFVRIKSFFLKQYWVNKDWTPKWLGKGMQAKPALKHQRRTGSFCEIGCEH